MVENLYLNQVDIMKRTFSPLFWDKHLWDKLFFQSFFNWPRLYPCNVFFIFLPCLDPETKETRKKVISEVLINCNEHLDNELQLFNEAPKQLPFFTHFV